MNPAQTPGTPASGGTPVPPSAPQPGGAPVADIPEEGFGFADDQPAALPPVARPAQQMQPAQPVVSSPAPAAPVSSVPPSPRLYAPTPPPAPAPAPRMPADIMPPQAAAAPIPTQPPTTAAAAPIAPVAAAPLPPPVAYDPRKAMPLDPNEPFDPTRTPASAAAAPQNPVTASYTPPPVTHLPDDLANRIAEKPMQNSSDIMRQVKNGLEGSRLKSILSFFVFTAAIFVAAFLINQFIFQSYYVEGTSMTPTLQNDDRLIISKVERTLAAVQGKPYIPDRGQIVVLDSSIVGLNGQHEQLIKRVIGLPGDRVHIEGGIVIITNSEHPEGYDVTNDLGLTNLQATYSDGPIDLTVPEGQVYVIGDNREQGGSYDSRAFGPIDGNKIQGRLWGRILPLDKAQLY